MPETQPIHSNALASEVRDKEPERQAIADAVAAFKAKGGKVQASPAKAKDRARELKSPKPAQTPIAAKPTKAKQKPTKVATKPAAKVATKPAPEKPTFKSLADSLADMQSAARQLDSELTQIFERLKARGASHEH